MMWHFLMGLRSQQQFFKCKTKYISLFTQNIKVNNAEKNRIVFLVVDGST